MDVLISTTNSDLPPPPPSVAMHEPQNLLLTKPFQYIPKPSPSSADIITIDPSTDAPLTPDYSCMADPWPVEECNNNELNGANWNDMELSMMMQPYYYQDELVNGCYTDDPFDTISTVTTTVPNSMTSTHSMVNLPTTHLMDHHLLWNPTNNGEDNLWYLSYVPSSSGISF
ncbi:hypothetical protein EC973_000780 [Apophysomyces ossiformis]|uniref:Uncharacterized protein n=1 Tax=Apophysomyces ossiformis TaxID=679940 RepID=A0A8H7BIS2_9FUNG|nr:hypothetical protein EC973_000780 [Apophysomyces ossiformis]